MRTVTARLRTLCGCVRYVVLPGPAPQVYRVPIRGGESEPDAHRAFALLSLSPTDVAVDADYIEVG